MKTFIYCALILTPLSLFAAIKSPLIPFTDTFNIAGGDAQIITFPKVVSGTLHVIVDSNTEFKIYDHAPWHFRSGLVKVGIGTDSSNMCSLQIADRQK